MHCKEVLKELIDRRSVRIFLDRPIEDVKRAAILEAAVNAPTAGNQQLYTILDIREEAIRKALVETCDHQPFIAQARLILIFCADCKKWYDGFADCGCQPRAPGVGDLLLAVSDANIAAQNAVTAAWSLGIGSCYIGDVMENCEAQRQLLGLPKYVFPAAMVVFGYPAEGQLTRRKPQRAPMDQIVAIDHYPAHTADDRKAMFYRAPERTYEDYMKAFCARKYNSDFSREMTRSVGIYLKDFEE